MALTYHATSKTTKLCRLSEKKRDWPMIAALLTAVVIAAFYVTYGVIDGWSIFAILLVIIVVAIVTPFGIMLGRLVSRWLGFKPRDLGEGELIAPMKLTYHATPKHHWQASGADESYLSTDFADEGFIHCTDSIDALPSVLTTYYRDEPATGSSSRSTGAASHRHFATKIPITSSRTSTAR